MEPIELELAFYGADADYYRVELRFQAPDPNDNQFDAPIGALINLPKQPSEIPGNDREYGKTLTDAVFSDGDVRARYQAARTSARLLSRPLRIRLRIDRTARLLHSVKWELLLDPDTNTPLATDTNIYLSRFLARNDFRTIKLRRRSTLRALVVVADPTDAGGGAYQYPKPKADLNKELKNATNALGGIEVEYLPQGEPATLPNILRALAGEFDILYLVCHGMFNKESWLLLENEDGAGCPTRGADLVRGLSELQQRPRLILLASCESSFEPDVTTSDEGAFHALGPRIAEAGVPAVLAIQGRISVKTASLFMVSFFRELQRDGQVDRAVAISRQQVEAEADFHFPVLFMRLRNGKIWYEPGFAAGGQTFDKWPTLLRSIYTRKCTPILGSGLLEPYIGTTRDVAWHLSVKHKYPIWESEREDLPQVCQYLETTLNTSTMQYEVLLELSRQVVRLNGVSIPGKLDKRPRDIVLADETLGDRFSELITAVWEKRRNFRQPDSYSVLAALPFLRYITTCPDPLLETALRGEKDPRRWVFDWREQNVQAEQHFDLPSEKEPLLIYLFGRFDEPDSLVWSEDNYFEYLISSARRDPRLHSDLTSTLANSTLLFLGFRLDEWDFRVLLRSMLMLQGAVRSKRFAHVAVQIDPVDANAQTDPSRIRRYLESYFQNVNISIFWGSVEDFTRELHMRWGPYAQQASLGVSV